MVLVVSAIEAVPACETVSTVLLAADLALRTDSRAVVRSDSSQISLSDLGEASGAHVVDALAAVDDRGVGASACSLEHAGLVLGASPDGHLGLAEAALLDY